MTPDQEREAFEKWIYDTYGFHGDKLCLLTVKDLLRAWQARAALQSQDREDAEEVAATLAAVLHFISKQEEPELYADVEKLCAEFGDHARRIEEKK